MTISDYLSAEEQCSEKSGSNGLSDMFLQEMIEKTKRKDRIESLNNIKKACDYLINSNSVLTYASVAYWIKSIGGSPSSAQVIKNDSAGLKRYIDLRKQEANNSGPSSIASSRKVVGESLDSYSELFDLDKDSVVTKLILQMQINKLLVRKANDLASLVNRTVKVEVSEKTANEPTVTKSGHLLIDERDDLIEGLYQILVDQFDFKFSEAGVFISEKRVADEKTLALLAKSLSLTVDQLLAFL